jgi:hypothetical protein
LPFFFFDKNFPFWRENIGEPPLYVNEKEAQDVGVAWLMVALMFCSAHLNQYPIITIG